jgi:sortase A
VGLFVLTLGYYTYDLGVRWFAARSLAEHANDYVTTARDLPSAEVKAMTGKATEYNARLAGGTPARDIELGNARGYPLYRSLLSPAGMNAIASLNVPSIRTRMAVHHGNEELDLPTSATAAEHLYGTSLPVGGPSTHTAIAAHSGWRRAPLFNDLQKVRTGDVFTIETMGNTHAYQVRSIEKIRTQCGPEDAPHTCTNAETDAINAKIATALAIHPGKDEATLVACWPSFINTHRLLVTGERVTDPDPSDPQVRLTVPFTFPWWVVTLAIMIGVAGWFWPRRRGHGHHSTPRAASRTRGTRRPTRSTRRALAVGLAAAFTCLAVNPAVASDTGPGVDPSRTGSITLHVAMTNPATGRPDPVAGARWTARRATGVDLTTTSGWQAAQTASTDPGALQVTGTPVSAISGPDGTARLEHLPVGLYRVAWANPAATGAATSFWVTIPTTDPENAAGWLYDVHAYPKAVPENSTTPDTTTTPTPSGPLPRIPARSVSRTPPGRWMPRTGVSIGAYVAAAIGLLTVGVVLARRARHQPRGYRNT